MQIPHDTRSSVAGQGRKRHIWKSGRASESLYEKAKCLTDGPGRRERKVSCDMRRRRTSRRHCHWLSAHILLMTCEHSQYLGPRGTSSQYCSEIETLLTLIHHSLITNLHNFYNPVVSWSRSC